MSHWVKKFLQECGVNTEVLTAHSTRHVATSAAASKGVSVESIRKIVGWTSESQVFTRFYERPIVEGQNIASAIVEYLD